MAYFLGVKRPGRTADHFQFVQELRRSGAVLPSALRRRGVYTDKFSLRLRHSDMVRPAGHGVGS